MQILIVKSVDESLLFQVATNHKDNINEGFAEFFTPKKLMQIYRYGIQSKTLCIVVLLNEKMELIGAAGIQNRIKLRMVNYNILKYVIPTIVIYFFDFARLYLRLSILQSGEKIDGRISFFYILKRYRGLGFGQYFIHQLLILFPKISHIDTSISNKKALYLYSKFDFIEYRRVFGLVGLRRSRIL